MGPVTGLQPGRPVGQRLLRDPRVRGQRLQGADIDRLAEDDAAVGLLGEDEQDEIGDLLGQTHRLGLVEPQPQIPDGDRFPGRLSLDDPATEVLLPVMAKHEVLVVLLAEPQRVRNLLHEWPFTGLHHDPVFRMFDRPADLGMNLPQIGLADLGGEMRMSRIFPAQQLVEEVLERLPQPGAGRHLGREGGFEADEHVDPTMCGVDQRLVRCDDAVGLKQRVGQPAAQLVA